MKNMNDVVSYLNNVLGPTHDLTIAARNAITTPESDLTTTEFTDADQCVLWYLSGIIFTVDVDRGEWNLPNIRALTLHDFTRCDVLDEAVVENELEDKYPREATTVGSPFYLDVIAMIHSPRFDQLFERVTDDWLDKAKNN